VTCYIPRWFTRQQTVTHPSTNRAQCRLTSLIKPTPLTTTLRRHPGKACDADMTENGRGGVAREWAPTRGGYTAPSPDIFLNFRVKCRVLWIIVQKHYTCGQKPGLRGLVDPLGAVYKRTRVANLAGEVQPPPVPTPDQSSRTLGNGDRVIKVPVKTMLSSSHLEPY